MRADNSRLAAARSHVLATLFLALLPGAAAAQQPPFPHPSAPADRVEKVRQALQQFGRDADSRTAAQKELDERAAALRGAAELGKALILDEWGLFAVPDLPNPAGREGIGKRFEKALREALEKGGAARQCAAATLFGEMGAAPREGHRPNLGPDALLTAVLSRLLPDVAGLSASPDGGVREAAARALGRYSLEPENAVKELGKFLGDKEAAVKRAAAEGLVRQARGGDATPGTLGSPSRGPAAIATACGAVVPAAAKGLNDDDEQVSRHCADAIKQAARALGQAVRSTDGPGRLLILGPPGLRPPVPPGAAGEDEVIAKLWEPFRPAAGALGAAARSLTPLLKSASAARRVRACQALEAVAEFRAHTLRMAGSPGALAKALGANEAKEDPVLAGLKEALPDLARCVARADVEERLAALYVLEALGLEAVPAAVAASKALADGDPFVRWAAARVLGKVAPAKPVLLVAALAEKVGDENGDVRITVLAALERYGPAAVGAVKEVSQALKGGDEQTRLWAVRVLAAIGPEGREKTTAPLLEALSAKEVAVRRIAVRALAGFGKPGATATDALRAALKDDDAEVRRLASEALLVE